MEFKAADRGRDRSKLASSASAWKKSREIAQTDRRETGLAITTGREVGGWWLVRVDYAIDHVGYVLCITTQIVRPIRSENWGLVWVRTRESLLAKSNMR